MKSKFYLLLLLFLTFYSIVRANAQCSDVILTSQAQVDAFPATYGCQNISGVLYIAGNDITHLDSLYMVQSAGRLAVSQNPVLQSLRGLDGITSVGELEIYNNAAITDLSGLSKLDIVQSAADIGNNAALTSLNGAGKLRYVSAEFIISGNPVLTNLRGLTSLAYVGTVELDNNPKLVDLEGFSGLNHTSYLVITRNSGLTNLNGFRGITYAEYVDIRNNNALSDLEGLAQLDSIRLSLTIGGNSSLANLNGLRNLRVAANVTVAGNTVLTDIGGLSRLQKINQLYVQNNPALSQIGFQSLRNVSELVIQNNDALLNLDGFSSLQTIGTILTIADHSKLANINGLSGSTSSSLSEVNINGNSQLTSLHGIPPVATLKTLVVWNNPLLTDISALNTITTLAGEVIIQTNKALPDLSGLSSLTDVTGSLIISGNTALTSIGMTSLKHVGGSMPSFYPGLFITNNASLQNLDGFSALTTVDRNFVIDENPNLRSLQGIEGLKKVGQTLEIQGNPLLTNIEALGQLSSVGADPANYYSVWIQGNASLPNLRGLESLKTIPGTFIVELNNALLNLDGLNGITSIEGNGGQLIISRNNSLINVDGLSSLKLISGGGPNGGGGLSISENPSLTNINGISSLETIYSNGLAFLSIFTNASLTNIDGLSKLTTLAGANVQLSLKNNPALIRCCGLYPLFHADGIHGPAGQTIDISGNGAGCTRADIIAGGACNPQDPADQPTSLVFSQITDNSLQLSFTDALSRPAGYITLMRAASAPYPPDAPADGVTYQTGVTIGSSLVVGVGSQTSLNVSQLTPNTVYYFDVFSYNETHDYRTSDPLAGNQKTNNLPAPGLTFSSVSSTSLNLSFAASPTLPAGYIVLMRAYGSPSPDDVPQDGTTYHLGGTLGSSTIVVGLGGETTYHVTYLEPSTPYYFDVYSFTSAHDYDTDNLIDGNQTTAASSGGPNNSQPTNLLFSNITNRSMTVSFTPAAETPDGYITLLQAFGSPYPDVVPLNGTSYKVGDGIGTSAIVVGWGSSTTLNIVSLEANTDYYYNVFSFKNTQSGYEYVVVDPLSGRQSTSSSLVDFEESKSVGAPYPNPFVEATTIPFTTTEETYVHIIIYDRIGRKVSEVAAKSFVAGDHKVTWDRMDANGNKMVNDFYYYSVKFNGKEQGGSGMIVAK